MRWLASVLISLVVLAFVANALIPIGRRAVWPLGEYSMYSPLKTSSQSVTEFTLYGLYRSEDNSELQEFAIEDSQLIYPFTWDELRKSIRFMIENGKMPRVRRSIVRLVKRNYVLRLRRRSEKPLLGVRLYKETWNIDTNKVLQRGKADNRRLLIDENFN
jgi:hypothetical protein